MPCKRCSALLIALACLALHGPRTASAESLPASAESAGMPTLLYLSFGSAPPADRLQALRSELREVPVELVAEVGVTEADALPARVTEARALTERHRALGATWIARDGQSDRYSVYVYDAPRSRLLVRHLRTRGTETATNDQLAIVLRATVTAILEGSETGMQEIALAEPNAPRPAAEAASNREAPELEPARGLELAAAYTLTRFLTGDSWQHGAAIALVQSLPERLYAQLGYTFLSQVTLDSDRASASLRRHPLELALGYMVWRRGFELGLETAMIVDVVTRETTRTSAGLQPAPSGSETFFAVATRLRPGFALSRRVRFVGSLGAELLLNDFQYVVRQVGSEARLLPLRVRPRLEVGIAAALW